jgi:hypothetical protein
VGRGTTAILSLPGRAVGLDEIWEAPAKRLTP